ncbi:hypothetical protein BC777_2052 [Yoonia maricola]|uniref:Uncharacterized protein n=1 Tax=Yoonia maricola TaxID=420999 RepID=A0A2M8WQG5_9RHOB|nr:hypothetical protein BC777_2052 [Yoonia maricola]
MWMGKTSDPHDQRGFLFEPLGDDVWDFECPNADERCTTIKLAVSRHDGV